MSYFLLGIGLLLLGMLVFNWVTNSPPRRILDSGKWIIAGIAILFAVFLLATGRIGLIWTALLGLLPWIGRIAMLRNLWHMAKGLRGPSAGKRSTVSTRFFDMELDHDSGQMDGQILEGRFVGRRLSDLDEGERLDLAREVAAGDAQSMRLLETYLDRTHGPEWRRQFGGDDGDRSGSYRGGFGDEGRNGAEGGAQPGGAMSRSEALGILGLPEGASESDIRQAHRRLMKVVHPDVGGSDDLARRVNEAKRVLLGK